MYHIYFLSQTIDIFYERRIKQCSQKLKIQYEFENLVNKMRHNN